MGHKGVLVPITHGTNAGNRAHERRGEQPCADCRRAALDYRQERRRIARSEGRADKPRPKGPTRPEYDGPFDLVDTEEL